MATSDPIVAVESPEVWLPVAGFPGYEVSGLGRKQGHISDICLGKIWKCVPDDLEGVTA